jgi:hypothetical protein
MLIPYTLNQLSQSKSKEKEKEKEKDSTAPTPGGGAGGAGPGRFSSLMQTSFPPFLSTKQQPSSSSSASSIPSTAASSGSSSLPSNISETLKQSIIASFLKNWNLGPQSLTNDAENVRKLSKLRAARLAVVYGRLSKDRITLWEAVITAQIGFLSAIALPASVSCEDFLSIVWGVNTMAALGEEFCGSDSAALRACLVVKSKEYFHHLHAESIQVLRLMIDSESWQRVNVNLEDMGGVLGVLKKNIVIASRQRSGNGAVEGDKSSILPLSHTLAPSSLLISFITHGNPFSTPEEAVVRLGKIPEGDDTDTADGTGVGSGTGVNDSTHPNGALALGCELFATREALELPPRTHVLTQTCLNGLARYTGRYLQLMYLLPGTAPDIFTSLCSLYDYYLCAVYCGFVPLERQTILKGGSNNRPAAAAPDRKQEFEVSGT